MVFVSDFREPSASPSTEISLGDIFRSVHYGKSLLS